MTNLQPMQITTMVVFAIPALILAFVPLYISLVAMSDIANWQVYALIYVGSAILSMILTGIVYLIRDIL